MTLSPTCAFTAETSKNDDSDFDDILGEILAEEEARIVKNSTSVIGQKKKSKKDQKEEAILQKDRPLIKLILYYNNMPREHGKRVRHTP
jgi:hypothetical protein